MSRYGNPMSSGDPNCGLCIAQFQERWSSLPEIQDHAEDGCPYCANMLEGLLYLVPDLETRYGEDAQFRFQRRRDMTVYADPNGSLRDARPKEDIKLQYRWFMVDEQQPSEPKGDTAAESSFTQANTWIQECLANHKLCGNDEPSPLPTRVLDLGEMEASEEENGDMELGIKLIESSSGQTGRYISLSHSWGGEHPLTTTTATIAQHKEGILLSNLPATFRDACHIARRLCIRYLWIDSLCIIQDSPTDWEHEASRMAHVYRNSWLTVYATASSSPSSGIFRSKQAVWIAADDPDDAETLDILFPEAAKLRENLRLSLRFATVHPDFSPYADPAKQKATLPLLARAWGYQERLLAPRVLHFGPQEVFWECMQRLECDCGSIKEASARPENMGVYASRDTTGQLPPKVSHYAALHVGRKSGGSKTGEAKRRKKLLARWQEMVEEYTNRALTFSADRLPAFSGVAAEMVEALGMRYRAGQWEETMPQALLYERADSNSVARLAVNDARPAPSWSWASPDVSVRFLIPLTGPPEWASHVVHAKVLEVRTVPSGADERGHVKREESYLMLSAELVKGSLCFSEEPYLVPNKPWTYVRDAAAKGIKGPQAALGQLGPGSFMVRVGKKQPVWFVPDVALCDEHGEWLWKGEEEICCAKIMESDETGYWLVLRRTDEEGPTYERIGVVKDHEITWPSKGDMTSIKIV